MPAFNTKKGWKTYDCRVNDTAIILNVSVNVSLDYIRINDQGGKHDITNTTGDPDRNEKYQEYPRCQQNRYLRLRVH